MPGVIEYDHIRHWFLSERSNWEGLRSEMSVAVNQGIYIGLDIGGTKLLVAAADVEGNILRRTERPTPLDLAEGLDALHQMARTVAEGQPIIAFGAAAGGPLDPVTGIVSPLHQPRWRSVPLKEIFEHTYGCPLAVDVDTNVAALGEYQFGGARDPFVVYVTISTGVGGGFLIEGEILRGMSGAHPEVGHHAIPYRCSAPYPIVCACGASNCLEAFVSGTAIRKLYGKPAELLGPDEWAEVAYNLGQGLRNIAVMYTPNLIVLGGGVAIGAGARLVDPAVEVMRANLKTTPEPEVRLSRLGRDTALLGTIAFAMRATAKPDADSA